MFQSALFEPKALFAAASNAPAARQCVAEPVGDILPQPIATRPDPLVAQG